MIHACLTGKKFQPNLTPESKFIENPYTYLIGVGTRIPPPPPQFVGFESLAKSSIFLANLVAFTLSKNFSNFFSKRNKNAASHQSFYFFKILCCENFIIESQL